MAPHILNKTDSRHLGQKKYELVNHLSNVLVVVSDRKFGQQLFGYTANTTNTGTHTYNTLANEYIFIGSGGNFDQTSNTNETTFDVYLPEVLSFSDYYPFHMQMPGRFDNSAGYRYGGSNGQEKETEITGNSSHYSAEYWMYDARLGRRWNVDQVKKEWESPYSVVGNNSIYFTDKLGLDGMPFMLASNTYIVNGNKVVYYNSSNSYEYNSTEIKLFNTYKVTIEEQIQERLLEQAKEIIKGNTVKPNENKSSSNWFLRIGSRLLTAHAD